MLFPASGVIKLSYEARSINSDRPTEIPTSNLDTRRGGHRERPPPRGYAGHYARTLSIIILGKNGLYLPPLLLPLYRCVYVRARTHTRIHTKVLICGSYNVWKYIPNLPWPVSPGSPPTAGRLPFFCRTSKSVSSSSIPMKIISVPFWHISLSLPLRLCLSLFFGLIFIFQWFPATSSLSSSFYISF